MANLTSEQIAEVRNQINAGAKLGDIQKMLNDKFGINMTYMDVRFLVDDLDLTVQDPKRDDAPSVTEAPIEEAKEVAQEGVTVELSPVQAPGVLAGGKVTFSDGVTVMWALDADGRLQLDGVAPEYRPSQTDIADFQEKLRTILSGQV